jgi:hypothetical protein
MSASIFHLTPLSLHFLFSFLKCGYSIEEIEEAAAISLKYKKQTTLSRILYPQKELDDAVCDRFSSIPGRASGTSFQKKVRRKNSPTADSLARMAPMSRRHSSPPEAPNQPLTPPIRLASPSTPHARKGLTRTASLSTDSRPPIVTVSQLYSVQHVSSQPLVCPSRVASPPLAPTSRKSIAKNADNDKHSSNVPLPTRIASAPSSSPPPPSPPHPTTLMSSPYLSPLQPYRKRSPTIESPMRRLLFR